MVKLLLLDAKHVILQQMSAQPLIQKKDIFWILLQNKLLHAREPVKLALVFLPAPIVKLMVSLLKMLERLLLS